jgi:hypothetical protein
MLMHAVKRELQYSPSLVALDVDLSGCVVDNAFASAAASLTGALSLRRLRLVLYSPGGSLLTVHGAGRAPFGERVPRPSSWPSCWSCAPVIGGPCATSS